MSGFRTDSELLARRAEAFDGLAARADRIAGALRLQIDDYGACWGADAVGAAFAEGHVTAADAALSGIEALPSGLADVGFRLIETATAYAASERTSQTAIGDVDRQDV